MISVFLAWLPNTFAQAVKVTISADRSVLTPGEQTTIRVLAQVLPELRPRAQQIFAWHLDLVQEFAESVAWQTNALVRPTSDQDPSTSSGGTVEGGVWRGIFDTLAARTNAGVANPIEILTFPVTARLVGTSTFRVRAGTAEDPLSSDFLVAGTDGVSTWTGGDYADARVTLEVREPALVPPSLSIAYEPGTPSREAQVTLTFPVVPGQTYVVQAAETLGTSASWQDLADSPHNNGLVRDAFRSGPRFYRVRVTAFGE
ncbi:MAG: hypothetical protein IT580_18435 [Verrucomicrobiales bacterium]|nr:hypothetical protein [Verrucomicrobiales bacterium]